MWDTDREARREKDIDQASDIIMLLFCQVVFVIGIYVNIVTETCIRIHNST